MGSVGFLVLGIDPGVSQFWIGEGDQLACVTGVSHDLLVASHAGVEDHFTDGGAAGAAGQTPQHGSIGKHQ